MPTRFDLESLDALGEAVDDLTSNQATFLLVFTGNNQRR